jgi:hypothetical protein
VSYVSITYPIDIIVAIDRDAIPLGQPKRPSVDNLIQVQGNPFGEKILLYVAKTIKLYLYLINDMYIKSYRLLSNYVIIFIGIVYIDIIYSLLLRLFNQSRIGLLTICASH